MHSNRRGSEDAVPNRRCYTGKKTRATPHVREVHEQATLRTVFGIGVTVTSREKRTDAAIWDAEMSSC